MYFRVRLSFVFGGSESVQQEKNEAVVAAKEKLQGETGLSLPFAIMTFGVIISK